MVDNTRKFELLTANVGVKDFHLAVHRRCSKEITRIQKVSWDGYGMAIKRKIGGGGGAL